jgi:hypothetical protein
MNNIQKSLIVVGFILLALMATNPSIEDHKEGVKKMYKEKLVDLNKDKRDDLATQIGTGIGMLIGDGFIDKIVSRDNFLLFSLTKVSVGDKTKNIGVGILGQVFIQDYDKIKTTIDENSGVNPEYSSEPEIQRDGIVLEDMEVMKNDLDGDLYLPDAQKIAVNKGNGWRVPTLNELRKLYNNRSSIGGFNSSSYISSDESSSDGTYRQIQVLNFSNGEIGWDFYCCKGPGGKVRLVRSL